jgi:hypothetical protein
VTASWIAGARTSSRLGTYRADLRKSLIGRHGSHVAALVSVDAVPDLATLRGFAIGLELGVVIPRSFGHLAVGPQPGNSRFVSLGPGTAPDIGVDQFNDSDGDELADPRWTPRQGTSYALKDFVRCALGL